MTEITLCSPQPIYVIVEAVYPGRGIPQLWNTVGPELTKVQRHVAQVCAVEDMFFDGERLDGFPGVFELLREYLTPGTQITTRRTGRRELSLVYAGFRNILRAFTELPGLPSAVTRERDLGTPPRPFVYGVDPIPHVHLYGNPRVIFTSPGGTSPPRAVAVYHATSGRLEVPPHAEREAVIRGLLLR
ncbi:hypothetical protein WME94_16580 [Sorangium sp. So ce429]